MLRELRIWNGKSVVFVIYSEQVSFRTFVLIILRIYVYLKLF